MGRFRHRILRRMCFRAACLLAATFGGAVLGQTSAAPPPEDFRVLPAPGAVAPEMSPYLLYQTSVAWQQDLARRERWSKVKTEADLFALRGELRRSVLQMIGGLPAQKSELHANVTGRLRGDGFHIEKLLYESLRGYYVTALVYVPENGQKVHPAVLVTAGHSPRGKIHYAELCQRLVLRGYLVIAWDPVGQGERSQFWDPQGQRSRYNLICAEHAVLGNLAYLAGASLARWEVWDGMRAVDYLLTRTDVDPNRINLTGTSGGGFQAALLGALDERIKVIIPSCYITALPMRVENRIFVDPDSDPEQDLEGFVSHGVDHPGLLLMMYPRAVMVATVTLDFFPVQGAHKTFGEVSSLYGRFGHADRIAFAESYSQHQYTLQNQEAALRFLDHFNGMPMQHGLPEVQKFADADLRVTRSGQVSVDYPESKKLVSYLAEFAAEARTQPHETLAAMYRQQAPDVASWAVKRYAGVASSGALQWERLGTSTRDAVTIDRYVIHHSMQLQMPLLHIHPAQKRASRGAVLWFSLQGHATAKDWPEITALLRQGYEVYSFDFRGLGETRMNYRAISEDDPELVKGDFDHAYVSPLSSVLGGYVYNSVLTGRPYFFQLMDDVRIAARFVESRDTARRPAIFLREAGDQKGIAASLLQVDGGYKLFPGESAPAFDWARAVATGQEDWPIAYLVPGGALLR